MPGSTGWLMSQLPREGWAAFPYARFLLTGGESFPAGPRPEGLPLARHFENMGQVFFRSGSGERDTYATLVVGGALGEHKQYDHLHFGIYHRGFLALDTGTRPEPGMHLYNYYCRTIAHNSLLIELPGERMPSYWGKAEGSPAPGEQASPPPNDGGQREGLCSRPAAFESREHYAYVAGDAGSCYHPDKCRLALRQFVFLPPHHFVVFDRVSSVSAEQRKTWLLHTATEPVFDGRTFHADEGEGRLFCRTLLPEDALLEKVGGPGRQFWNGGRNWPLPAEFRAPDTTRLLGQWRVEVRPGSAREQELFLHLLQVGDQGLAEMVESRTVRQDGLAGVRFSYQGKDYELLFAVRGAPSGHLTIREGNRLVVNAELATEVQPQSGFSGDEE